MRLRHTGEKSLQALAKKGSLESASTCNMKLGGHGNLDKRKVKFGTSTHRSESLLDCIHVRFGYMPRLHRLEAISTFVSFIDNLSMHCWIYLMRQKFDVLNMLVMWKDMIEKQTGKKIKELQIGNVEKYKNQFL